MHIVLVGFSGSGKSTVGKKLANQLGYEFIDLDQVFEETHSYTIANFFLHFGEPLFRDFEYKLLNDILSKPTHAVIATGGGAPCCKDAMQRINNGHLSIYIQMSEKSLLQRLRNAKKRRPLTDKKNDEELGAYIRTTLNIREPYYLQAHIHIKGINLNIKELADQIKNNITK